MSIKGLPSDWPTTEDETRLNLTDRRKGYLDMRNDRSLIPSPVGDAGRTSNVPRGLDGGTAGMVKGYREYLQVPLNNENQFQAPSMKDSTTLMASGRDDETKRPDGNSDINSPPDLMSSSVNKRRENISDNERDEGFVPTESGERLVVAADYVEAATRTRDNVGGSFFEDSGSAGTSAPIPPSAGKIAVCTPATSTPLNYQEGVVEQEVLRRMSYLLSQNTLEAHKEALKVLRDSGLLAVQRWEEIHSNPDAKHNFSRVSKKRVNTFAKRALQHLDLNSDSVLLELGSGFGNDALYFARRTKASVIGVDSSQAAVTEALKNIRSRGMDERVNLTCHDFFKVLEASKGLNLDVVYSHSTLHYSPPLILQQKTFPLIADVLRANNAGGKSGKLCLAMKTVASASARSANQYRLSNDDPYNPSVDLRDKVFRIYPDSKEDVIALLEPSFDINHARIVPVRGYDRNGETEIFCYVVATPKPAEQKG